MDSIHGGLRGESDAERVAQAQRQAQALLSDPTLGRIFQASTGRDVPVARQVFINRNLHLGKVEAVGFDMDYTLAIYHLRRIEQLSYDMTIERLVTHKGYPAELRGLKYDHAAVIRGLFIDKRYGNLLKIDRFGHVGRAFHGSDPLSEEQLDKLYRNERIRLKNDDYAWLDTLFALPEGAIFLGCVDLFEKELHRPLDYRKLFDDVRESIDTVHRDNTLKAVIRQDIAKYIYKDEELGPALHKLRSGGKKLFVLTNSLWDYTQAVMSYLLDGLLPEYPSWRNYFDVVITGAAKPAFFSEARPFLEIDSTTEANTVLGEAQALERGKVYQGGNLAAFERLTGIAGGAVLYVGDHIYGDILKSKKTSMWRTCMIVQEIEDEITYLETRRDEVTRLADLEQLQSRLDDEVQRHKTQLNQIERKLEREATGATEQAELEAQFKAVKAELDHLRRSFKDCAGLARTLEEDIERGFNPRWGLHFKEGVENSRFGEQVEQYACLYTSRVSNLGSYSPMHTFRSAREQMPHELAGALSAKLGALGSEGLPKAANRAPTEIP